MRTFADGKELLVSIVIRSLNEQALIGRCLETLRRQRGGESLEIVVVDSGSTDGTTDIARRSGATVLEIPQEDFDYSRALNLGIERAGGTLIGILSAHAIPLDETWLERMTAPFEDPRVGGVCARQVPWPDCDPLEVARIRREFDTTRRVYENSGRQDVIFSNSASCIRRDAWESERFSLPFAEDLYWAKRIVEGGWRVVYEPRAAVLHSHNDSAERFARRLVDMSRAEDVVRGRTRTRGRALREAAGFLTRRLAEVLAFDEPMRWKTRQVLQTFEITARFLLHRSRRGAGSSVARGAR